MNVTLSPELVEQLDARVASGEFKSRDEVLHAAIMKVLSDPEEYRKKVKELNALIDEGEADLAAGRSVTVSSRKELHELFESL